MRVAVVGAGLSGTLTAVQLTRAGARVTLVEAGGDFGPGVAYATRDDAHRLNVPAARMSAFPDDPDHLVRWVAARDGACDPSAYLPRRVYGEYLRALLHGTTIDRVTGTVTDVRRVPQGAVVVLADGRRRVHDAVVLAVGSIPAALPGGLPDDARILTDPWAPGALAPAAPGERVVVLGSGLTAVDVALAVTARPGGGMVTAVSRRALLPHAHLPGLRAPAPPDRLPRAPASLAGLEAFVAGHVNRAREQGCDWRDAVDGLRPHVTGLWQLLPTAERRRFLRTLVRDWDVCRHRMAPAVADRVAGLRASGRLAVRAGALAGVTAAPEGLEVALRDGAVLRAERLVVCTGAGTDVRRQPLLGRLVARGLAAPDDLGLGVRTTPGGALLDAFGQPQPWLLTLGPPRRGELWETTAVAEIRTQAQALAHALTGSRGTAGAAVTHAPAA